MTASSDHRWYAKQGLGPVLHDFAVKRLFEIYRTDHGKQHLDWLSELGFASDLGL